MCTAVSFSAKDHYFGRTLDHTCTYGEEVAITPRNYPLEFRHGAALNEHYAIIGTAHVADGYPLYYDGANEKGLAMAGLNFVGYARYGKPVHGMDNIAQFELLPWVLGQCADVSQARGIIEKLQIVDTPFSDSMPAAELHWMLADKTGAVVVEAGADGLHVYDNPARVMTNNPGFPWHMLNLSNYMHLSPESPENTFGDMPIAPFSSGLGAVGLPGDMSSPSRFVRAAFIRANSAYGNSEQESVGSFFHILSAVHQPRGCCITADGEYMETVYSSCCNTDKGIYYYRTYDAHGTFGVDMFREDIDGAALIRYPLETGEITMVN